MNHVGYWERMFDEFKMMFPFTAEKAIGWWPSARREIMIMLNDNSKVIYDSSARTILNINSEDTMTDENKWRQFFAMKLREKMYDAGINHQDLADKIGVSRVMMSRYSNGHATPSYFIIRKIAKALQCSERELTDVCDIT